MIIKRVVLLAVCVILALAILLPACAKPAPPPLERPQNVELTILGFMAGTSSQLRVEAIAEAIRLEYPDWRVAAPAAGGEAQMVSKIIAGEADFYPSLYPRPLEIEFQAPLHPDINYEQATAYNLVMPMSPRYIHFFARGNTGLSSVREIVEQKRQLTWGVGAGGSALVVDKVLEHYGTSWEEAESWGLKRETVYITTAEGAEALQSGRVDIGLSWSGLPCPAYLGVTSDIKLLPIDEPGLVQMFKGLGYYEATIPAGTYPFVTKDIPTVAETWHLVARTDLPEDVVYYSLKAIFNHKDLLFATAPEFEKELTPEAIAASVARSQEGGIPYHPGALKFYREMGWIK